MTTADTVRPAATAAASARPSVITLAIKDKQTLQSAYIPIFQNGGLFISTTRPANLGDELYVILTLLDDPARIPVQGKVAWITPSGATGRPQGVGIHFNATDACAQARAKIETIVGSTLKGDRPTATV